MDVQEINIEQNQSVQRLDAILWRMEMLLDFPGGTEYPGVTEALRSAVFEARDITRELAVPRYRVVRNVEFSTRVDNDTVLASRVSARLRILRGALAHATLACLGEQTRARGCARPATPPRSLPSVHYVQPLWSGTIKYATLAAGCF